MNEFELIRTFFATQPVTRADVVQGIGDDGAVLNLPAGMQLVVSSDVLAAGAHFLPETDPRAIGHKALAVNLSDLAAMGAVPAWFSLNVTLPEADERWLVAFCEGIYGLARRYDVQLIGGDTARGPLSIAITAYGFVPPGEALLRSGAQPGDRIYVTGELGDAGLALWHQLGKHRLPQADMAAVGDRLNRPLPRIEQGRALRGIASSAIDISDGLLADLGHILEASHVGARIYLDRIPVSAVYRTHLERVGWELALANGDDYELCFTVPDKQLSALERLKPVFGCGLRCIGEIVAGLDLQVFNEAGRPYSPPARGHDHFAV